MQGLFEPTSAARQPVEDCPSSELAGRTVASPFGLLELVASARGLVAVLWPQERDGRVRLTSVNGEGSVNPHLRAAAEQLDAFFAGRLRLFDVPLDPRGTDFQKLVWAALAEIPYGETRTYRDIAVAIGRPAACRAVGAANGRNPLSIIVPCHRVIGAGGQLTGFAGGLEIKRELLALEGIGNARLL